MKRALLALITPLLLWAIAPLPQNLPYYPITTEQELLMGAQSKIDIHYERGIDGYFKGAQKIKIHYRLFRVKAEKGAIVLVNGRTESILKYKEFIYDMNRNGYSIYAIDHRGQGESGRMTQDSQLGHVNAFENYVLDLHTFVHKIVKAKKSQHLFILGHSMGGAVTTRYIEQYPHDFEAAILNSPMLEANLFTQTTTKLLCKVMALKEDTLEYAPGTDSYDESSNSYKENGLTHSRIRFAQMHKMFQEYPETKLGGPSVGWIQNACVTSEKIMADAREIKIPLLLLRGTKDEIVNPEAEDLLCSSLDEQCHGYEIKGAWHELLIERDLYRDEAMRAILTYLDLVLQKHKSIKQ